MGVGVGVDVCRPKWCVYVRCVYVVYELDYQLRIYFMFETCNKIMHFRLNFYAYLSPIHSPFGFGYLIHLLSQITLKRKYMRLLISGV